MSRAAEEAQRPQPREQVITLLIRLADLHQQAAAADASADTSGDRWRGYHLIGAAAAVSHAVTEAQEPQPREEVITLLTQAADLHQQAAAAFATGNTERGEHLERAADALSCAADEAQRSQPQEQAITWFTQAADLHQQAAAAFASGYIWRGENFRDAALALSRAAEEAQRPQPREEAITRFTQVADLYQQVADLLQQATVAYVKDNLTSYVYLCDAVSALSRAAEEAQEPQPREQVITLLTQVADLSQQAADAFARGDVERGNHLSYAISALSDAAYEARRPQPQQAIINKCIREAQEDIERANRSGWCPIS